MLTQQTINSLSPEHQLWLLEVPHVFLRNKKTKFGFKYYALFVWNSFPLQLPSMKKTSYFQKRVEIYF